MKKKAKIDLIFNMLQKLYPNPPVPLNSVNSYTFLLAVLLSAQCTDERVNKITPQLFALADNPFEMVKFSVLEVQNVIRSCGLSARKATAIISLSQILIDKYNGEIPQKLELLEELPGVGHKTASVVVSQEFSQAAFPVDTHILRLSHRWGLSSSRYNPTITERELKNIFPKKYWSILHLQFIYFGREYCPAKNHKIKDCPICKQI